MESTWYEVERLPKSARKELYDFVEFLLEKYRKGKMGEKEKLNFGWEGALKNLRMRYTSKELQNKAAEWRGENI